MLDRDTVKKAMAAIKRAADYEYFFEQLTSPAWIDPLDEEGLFRDPPPIKSEGKYVSFPIWPQSKYLVRMAPLAPEKVLRVARAIESDNVRIHEDLVDAALAMPVQFAVKLVPRVIPWLESPYQLLLPQKAADLVARLAAGGEVEHAFTLARAILGFRQDPAAATKGETGWGELRRPRPKFEDFFYEEIIKRCVPALATAAGERTVSMLADLLQEAIAYMYPDAKGGDDYSMVWRPAIEAEEDIHRGDLEGELVTAVRDASEQVVRLQPDSLDRILTDFEGRPSVIFQRLAVHLVRVFASSAPEPLKVYLLGVSSLQNLRLHHEMWLLARDGFVLLAADDQGRYLDLILSIEMSKDYDEVEGRWPPDRLRRWYLYRRLDAVAKSLSGKWHDLHRSLESEFGKLEHSEFLSHSSVWVGPTSPRNTDELSDMTIDQLLEFLASWQPSSDYRDHSMEGLGRTLSAAVAMSPDRYAIAAMHFRGLDPTYVRGLLTGLFDSIRESRPFSWPSVVDLCAWVVEQPREIPGRKSRYHDLDPGWVWTRKAIADLLSAGFEAESGRLPFDLRTQAWQVLAVLTQDPDPMPDREKHLGGKGSHAASLSINTVRGESIHAVVRYGLWVRRHIALDVAERQWQGFDDAPEVRAVLDLHLDPLRDSSLAIRSVYGQWFPVLLSLDPKWTNDAVESIFPVNRSHAHLREAAWDGFILFGGVFDSVYHALRGEYEAAIQRIGHARGGEHTSDRVDERLSEHLMVLYWRGKITIDEHGSALTHFCERASTTLRAHALDFVGRTLYRDRIAPAEVIARLQQFWEWRVQETKAFKVAEKRAELREFGWWFASGMFPEDWAFGHLTDILRTVGQVEAAHLVIQRLAEIAPRDPGRSIRTLRLLVDVDDRDVGFGFRMHEVEQVLSRVLASGDLEAREKTIDLIHLFGAMGLRDYEHLLVSSPSQQDPAT